jgi:hypothetical protein
VEATEKILPESVFLCVAQVQKVPEVSFRYVLPSYTLTQCFWANRGCLFKFLTNTLCLPIVMKYADSYDRDIKGNCLCEINNKEKLL